MPNLNTPAQPLSSARLRLWGFWILASAIGGGITGYLEFSGLQFSATLLLQGFIVGLAQWLVLRGKFPSSWHWWPATGAGLALGYLLWVTATIPADGLFRWLQTYVGLWEVFWLTTVQMPFILLPVSLLQWLILRDPAHGATRWIPLSLGAGVLFGAGAAITAFVVQQTLPIPIQATLPLLVGWGLYALVTGVPLANLLDQVGEQPGEPAGAQPAGYLPPDYHEISEVDERF